MEFVEEGPENIWVAASDGDLQRVKDLIQEGVSVNAQDEYGHSPIHAAASYGQIAVLEYLLSVGADPNLRDNEGDTPLLVCELPEVFELLVRAGSDPLMTNNFMQGMLQKALEDENEVMIKYLVENGHVNDPNFKFVPGQFELNMVEGGEDAIEEGDEEEEEEGEEDTADGADKMSS